MNYFNGPKKLILPLLQGTKDMGLNENNLNSWLIYVGRVVCASEMSSGLSRYVTGPVWVPDAFWNADIF